VSGRQALAEQLVGDVRYLALIAKTRFKIKWVYPKIQSILVIVSNVYHGTVTGCPTTEWFGHQREIHQQ
jgi:hypothetical protein